jgi:thiosulfate/3-mercaptopyruvate sulfurtransferase
MRATIESGGQQILDARSAERFRAEAPEPRKDLRGGHMPGACNLPSAKVISPDGGLADRATLERLFAEAGIDLDRPIVTTCGSGVSAAMLALALARLGRWDTPVYDGSWTEWGGRADTPVAVG